MSYEGASAALMLKHKIQQVQEELDRYRNLHEQSQKELEAEKKKRSQVSVCVWVGVAAAESIYGVCSDSFR